MLYFNNKILVVTIASMLVKSQWVGASSENARKLKSNKSPKATPAPSTSAFPTPQRTKSSKIEGCYWKLWCDDGPDDRRLEPEEDSAECGSELYDLVLDVNENSRHVSLVAKPKSEGCPSIRYEAAPVMYMAKKKSRIQSDEDIGGFVLGEFSLSSLQTAFDTVEIDSSIPYDIVSNNCASLPVKMLDSLNIDPTDPNIITYAADHLSGLSDEMQMTSVDAYGVEDLVSDSIYDQL